MLFRSDIMIRQNVLVPGATSLVRWQSHWHVVRQNLTFFQNDFAGRIANRVMQTGGSLRESAMSSIRAVWYIGVYGVTAFALMTTDDWRLGIPIFLWVIGYVVGLRYFVPRLRELSRANSEGRSLVMARVVDSYTNILTVKLFARLVEEGGLAERALELMCIRAQERVAFGRKLADHGPVREEIARSACEIEQARLLTLAAAEKMDKEGNKSARDAIAMIKIVAPMMAQTVIDRAIQIHGAMGVSQDTFLVDAWKYARTIRIADGPDAVHLAALGKQVIRRYGAKA